MRAYVPIYHIVHVNLNGQWLSFNFPFYNSVYFFMAVLGLGCYVGFSLVERGLLFSCCAQASHCDGFPCCGAWTLGTWVSAVAAHRTSDCGTWA